MALSWDIQKQKSVPLPGALPLTPRPGRALPLDPAGGAGGSAPDPRAFPQLEICHYTTGCMTRSKVKVNEVQKL